MSGNKTMKHFKTIPYKPRITNNIDLTDRIQRDRLEDRLEVGCCFLIEGTILHDDRVRQGILFVHYHDISILFPSDAESRAIFHLKSIRFLKLLYQIK